MDNTDSKTPHETIRVWIERILQIKGWNPTRLAKEAGVSSSTISRALNDNRFILTTRTIDKIKKILSDKEERALTGHSERETTHLSVEFIPTGGIFEIPKTEMKDISSSWSDNADIKLYLYEEKDLELLGVIPGDIISVDESELGSLCKRKDIALVALKSFDGVISTVFRYFDPPYLLTKHLYAEHDNKPMLSDGEAVQIIGRAVGLVRKFPK